MSDSNRLTQFMGVKYIAATPMTYIHAVQQHSVRVGPDPSGKYCPDNTPGYLVVYGDGYKSWSPVEVFNEAYRQTSELSFGLAMVALMDGHKVSNADWNGKGMWVAKTNDQPMQVAAENFWSPHTAEHARNNGGSATVLPSLVLKTSSGNIQMGWVPSIADIYSNRWFIVQ
jgi:hypothetical protein